MAALRKGLIPALLVLMVLLVFTVPWDLGRYRVTLRNHGLAGVLFMPSIAALQVWFFGLTFWLFRSMIHLIRTTTRKLAWRFAYFEMATLIAFGCYCLSLSVLYVATTSGGHAPILTLLSTGFYLFSAAAMASSVLGTIAFILRPMSQSDLRLRD